MIVFFEKYTSIRNIILLGIIWIIFNLAFNLAFANFSGDIPDLKLYYSTENIYEIIGKYNDRDKEIYLRNVFMLDFLYPWVYAFFLSFIIFRLSSKPNLSLIPFIVLIFDYLENISLITLVLSYPEKLTLVASVAGIFTFLKWLMTALSIGVILYFIVLKIWNKYRFK